MRIKLMTLAVAGMLVAGCGATAGGKGLSGLFGQRTAPAPLSDAERQLARYGVLTTNPVCDSCDVTGGGNGKVADASCGDAKFGLVALDTDGLTGEDGKGRLNFLFEDATESFHVNGPVEFVRCLDIRAGLEGDTYGVVEFGGTTKIDSGLPAGDYRFVVKVTDSGEPDVGDLLEIRLFNSSNVQVFYYSCLAADGNIQLHPTRASQM